MSSRNNLYYFVDATEEDDGDILDILEQPDFSGDLSLIYTRRPSPIESLRREGEEVKILLCKRRDNDELVGFGVCAVREHYLQGCKTRVGYMSGLRIKKEYRKKLIPIARAYEILGDWLRDVGVSMVYTTVLEDNSTVIKMFSKRRKSMPNYNHLDNYTVYSPTVRRRRRAYKDCVVRKVEDCEIEKLVEFIQSESRASDLYPVIDIEDIRGKSYLAIDSNRFYVAVDMMDKIIACGYIDDRHGDKQHILHSYSGRYKLLSLVSPLLPIMGYPSLPRAGSILRYFNIAFLCVRDRDPEILDYFVRELGYIHRKDYDYYLLGLVESDPLNTTMSKLAKITYKSRLFRVDYEKTAESEAVEESLKNLYIECSLL